MSGRASRWEASRSPAPAHGGTAARARAAVKAAQAERLANFQRAKEIAHRQTAERTREAIEKPASGDRRLRPRARPQDPRWNCRTVRYREPRGGKNEARSYWTKEDADLRREILILVQAEHCALCGKRLSLAERDCEIARPSLEHVIPQDLGGENFRNIVAAHNRCNADKSNDLPTGCEVIWLLAVNARLAELPNDMQEVFYR